jgi:hypothetical protein
MIPSQVIRSCCNFVNRWLAYGGRSLGNLFIVLILNVCVFWTEALPQVIGVLPNGVCTTESLVPIGFLIGTLGGVACGSYVYRRTSRRGIAGRSARYLAVLFIAFVLGLTYWVDHLHARAVVENVSKYAEASPARYKLIILPSQYQTVWDGKPTANWHDRWASDVINKIEASDDLKRKATDACELLRTLSGLRILLWSASSALIAIISIDFLYALSGKNSPSPSRASKRTKDSQT